MTLPDWREEPVARHHNRRGFDCGQVDPNDFLPRHARQAHESGASKTYVAIHVGDGTTVLGFYTLSPAQIDFDLAPETARPSGGGRYSIGGFRLGRLAVSKAMQGQRLGGGLVQRLWRRRNPESASFARPALRCLHRSDGAGRMPYPIACRCSGAVSRTVDEGGNGSPRRTKMMNMNCRFYYARVVSLCIAPSLAAVEHCKAL